MNAQSALLRTLLLLARWIWASPATAFGLVVGGLGLLSSGSVRAVGPTLEFHGGFVRWFLAVIGRGAGAMTLGHVILGQNVECLTFSRDHELVHVRQYERWGPFFVPAYGLCALWLCIRGRHGYWDNPFEKEAYRECPRFAPRPLQDRDS